MNWLAGVDGCPGGWIAAFMQADAPQSLTVRLFATFAALLDAQEAPGIVAVDMPIGLPERIEGSGRGPEQAIRPLLGARQSSVFAIPSRAALYAEPGPFGSLDEMYAAHRRASEVARSTSTPSKGISIQAFNIFPKIREIDALLRTRPETRPRVFESHPELAFRTMKGGSLLTPKKVKGRPHAPGLDERRALLVAAGLPAQAIESLPPRGAAADDLLDALACLVVAGRLHRGEAHPHPEPYAHDGHGLPIAIWS